MSFLSWTARYRATRVVPILAAVLATSCTSPVDLPTASAVVFGIQQDSVLISRTYQLTVSVRDVAGLEITGKTVKYESLFPEVATVDTKGLVTPKAVGQATIKATVDGRTANANIRVLDRVTRVIIAPASEQVPLGQTRALVVTVTGASGQSIGGRAIVFSSSNPAVATVNAGGLVSGITKGSATITANVELDAVAGTSSVTVVDVLAAGVTMSPVGAQIMRLGAAPLQAVATPRDANGTPLSGRTITWATSNPAVATVSTNGLITAVAVGNASITAEVDSRLGTVSVAVTEVPPKSVTLAPDSLALLTSNSRVLVPVVVDSLNRTVVSLANRNVVWSSNNPSVASVSTAGVVTALTGGTARISVTVDGLRSNDVVVVVTDQVVAVQVTPLGVIPPVRIGNTLQLAAQALNNQNLPIPGKVFGWTSSNPSVATVNGATGLVTGVASGSVTVSAQVDGKSGSVSFSVTLVPIGSVTLVALDTLAGGDQKQYNPVVTDSAGRPVTTLIGRSVIWNSTNIPVASVSGQGIVQANTQQSGTALVNVIIDNVASNNMSVVVAQIATLAVNPNPLTIKIGTPQTLTVVTKDINGNTITTTRTPNFSVPAFPAILTVSPAGVVSGTVAGTTTITVTLPGVVGVATQIPVTVQP